jgi:tetratricopeptide (TPR) repeat protein
MQDAHRKFRLGLEHLAYRRLEQAASCFEDALARVRRGGFKPSPKLLSYCGYTLAMARKKYSQGLSLCRAAAEREFFNPDLFYNLGEVHLARGDRAGAHHAFRRGLALNPAHVRIRQRLKLMGIRKPPPIGFLPRCNVLNRVLGMALRSRA